MALEEPQSDLTETRLCLRPGCGAEYAPRAGNQRYCSVSCKRWVSNHSPAHLAAKERHDERRRASGLKARQDARWYAAGGYYKQYKAKLKARIVEHDLRRENARYELEAAFDVLGAAIAASRTDPLQREHTQG